jgi:hypothetical protein
MVKKLFQNSEDVVRGQNLVFLAVNLDFRAAVFAAQDAVALFDFKGTFLPLSSSLPVPSAMTMLSVGFSLAESGMMMPPFLVSFSSTLPRGCGRRAV